MTRLTSLQTRDIDAIETVEVFQDRKGYKTGAEALEKLIQRAKEFGLHVSDTPLIPAHIAVAGTVNESDPVTSPSHP